MLNSLSAINSKDKLSGALGGLYWIKITMSEKPLVVQQNIFNNPSLTYAT